jgi:hypothetical protein
MARSYIGKATMAKEVTKEAHHPESTGTILFPIPIPLPLPISASKWLLIRERERDRDRERCTGLGSPHFKGLRIRTAL